jgi:hypothetical protein
MISAFDTKSLSKAALEVLKSATRHDQDYAAEMLSANLAIARRLAVAGRTDEQIAEELAGRAKRISARAASLGLYGKAHAELDAAFAAQALAMVSEARRKAVASFQASEDAAKAVAARTRQDAIQDAVAKSLEGAMA